jgi:hypothetical protein
MNDITDAATFAPLEGSDPALPGDPFSRPRYAYGQLLGAEDFTAEQRYHLLRARMRNALLHGSGVVCGLDIQGVTSTDPPRTELRCGAGLAIDPLGREIYVPETICLDITGLANNKDFWPDLQPPPGDQGPTRRCYAVLSYRACLAAQTPAIAPPCSDADNALAYSRVLDSYRLCLEAAPPPDPHPLSRDWLNLKTPAAIRTRLQALSLIPADPGQLWAVEQDAKVLLAVLDLTPVGAPATDMTVKAVDTTVRALLPDVQTVAQIATGVRMVGPAAAAPFAVSGVTVAKGAGADAGKLLLTVALTADAAAGTVTDDSARVFVVNAGQWETRAVSKRDTPAGQIVLTVNGPWTSETTYQLVLSGGGAQPILDTAGRPLCGDACDGAPAPGHGRDYCLTTTFKP